jgi:arylsulfatase
MSCNAPQEQSESKLNEASKMDRTVLPIQPPKHKPITELDARNATKPEPFEIKAPQGAPNIVLVLIDDIGFGATETYGGPIATPTFDKLADNGVKFTQFHTTALCSPTRASLLSGRNHQIIKLVSKTSRYFGTLALNLAPHSYNLRNI